MLTFGRNYKELSLGNSEASSPSAFRRFALAVILKAFQPIFLQRPKRRNTANPCHVVWLQHVNFGVIYCFFVKVAELCHSSQSFNMSV